MIKIELCAEGGVEKMKIWHAPPTPALGSYCWVLLLGRVNFFGGGGGGREGWGGGGGHRTLKENLKLHNPSIKSIFRITSFI